MEQKDRLKPPTDGSCVGQDTNIWFPKADDQKSPTYKESYRRARANSAKAIEICNSCARRVQCLDYALHHEMHGIWGGKTEREREILRSRMGIKIQSISIYTA